MKKVIILTVLLTTAGFSAALSAGEMETERHEAGIMLDGTGEAPFSSLMDMVRSDKAAEKSAEASAVSAKVSPAAADAAITPNLAVSQKALYKQVPEPSVLEGSNAKNDFPMHYPKVEGFLDHLASMFVEPVYNISIKAAVGGIAGTFLGPVGTVTGLAIGTAIGLVQAPFIIVKHAALGIWDLLHGKI